MVSVEIRQQQTWPLTDLYKPIEVVHRVFIMFMVYKLMFQRALIQIFMKHKDYVAFRCSPIQGQGRQLKQVLGHY